ncbi:hypothetical protein WOLCODRAFT_166542 [Wolfiporia cocos MD-104 SS10]|uniref:F-box domain-containing protein n=1 Tax=Wolfiporia cocos (strain MD-104) TaxID=742152 RepID=A0A2H3J1Q3_WOLCO|nr:hypothetical protein WOLCODRAFT_166542 [Wolfiporia cocos MD-104 SS10]
MHHALESYDILWAIFRNFEPTTSYQDRTTLANAARVCRRVSSIALDCLWRHLTDPLPALKVISSFQAVTPTFDPDDENSYRDDEIEGDRYHLTDIISARDMERFQLYATRVRVLSFSSGKSWSSRAAVLSCIASLSRGPLFPNLQELAWSQTSPADFTILSFLTHAILRFSINHASGSLRDEIWSVHDPGLSTYLHAISSSLPNLRELSIQTRCCPSIILPLVRLRHLRKVSLYPTSMDCTLYRFLATLVNLVDLELRLELMDDTDVAFPQGFNALETLDISGRLSHIVRFAVAINSTAFRSVSIYDYDGESDERDLCLFFAVLRHKFRSSLRRVTCGTMLKKTTSVPLIDIIYPLMELPPLDSISFNSMTPFRTSSTDLTKMAASWPNLTALRICYDSEDEPPHISVLLELSRLCPHLRILTLPSLDFRSPVPDYTPPPATQPHALRALNVAFFPRRAIEDPMSVAQFIDTVFPELVLERTLVSARRPDGVKPDRWAWGRLREALGAFKARRMHSGASVREHGLSAAYHGSQDT